MYPESAPSATQSDRPRRCKLPRCCKCGSLAQRARERQLHRHAAELPFAIHSEEHGWGVVVRTPSGLPWWDTIHRAWYMVWYAKGLECRTIVPDEGGTWLFTWEHAREYVREEQEYHLRRRQYYTSDKSWRHDWKPAWRLIYQMWG